MPQFETQFLVGRPCTDVFAFFRCPANLLPLAPPDFQLRLLDAPDMLDLGSRVTLRISRWGVPQRIVTEVTALEAPGLLVEEHREGPFPRWAHTRRFEEVAEGTRLTDMIDYQLPGGLLGMMVTPSLILRDLEAAFAYRNARLEQLLREA